MMKLLLSQLALLGCAFAVSAMIQEEGCPRSVSPQQPAGTGTANNRVKRDIEEADLKRMFPAGDQKLQYLQDFHDGVVAKFHIAKQTTPPQKECVLEIGPRSDATLLNLKVEALKAIGKLTGLPEVVQEAATKETKYRYYATSPVPGPNLLALIAFGKVSQPQAKRWLYKLANLVLELHKKGYTYNGSFLFTVFVNEAKTNELLVQPAGTPPARLSQAKQIEDFDELLLYMRYVLGIWNPQDLQKMHAEGSAAFGKDKPAEKIKAFKEGLLTFLTKQGGWLANVNAADDSPLTSWTKGQALGEQTVSLLYGKRCLADAYYSA